MTNTKYLATRQIQIDAAHRVPRHDSKCKNVHGHRYVIEAGVSAQKLADQGSQSGMVADFGILKSLMTEVIHDRCDHALILWDQDPLLGVVEATAWNGESEKVGLAKVTALPCVPTAECLAEYWYYELEAALHKAGRGNDIEMAYIKVWETPNCYAIYPYTQP